MGATWFAEHLDYISAVNKALNALPEAKDFYVHVELREEGTGKTVGQWSDEIAPDAWYFEELPRD